MLQYTKAYSSFFSRLCINSDFYISASSKTWQGTAFILLKSTSPRLHIFFSLGRNSNEFAYTYCKPETLTALEAQLYLFILVVLSTTYITIIKEKRKKKKNFLTATVFVVIYLATAYAYLHRDEIHTVNSTFSKILLQCQKIPACTYCLLS